MKAGDKVKFPFGKKGEMEGIVDRVFEKSCLYPRRHAEAKRQNHQKKGQRHKSLKFVKTQPQPVLKKISSLTVKFLDMLAVRVIRCTPTYSTTGPKAMPGLSFSKTGRFRRMFNAEEWAVIRPRLYRGEDKGAGRRGP